MLWSFRARCLRCGHDRLAVESRENGDALSRAVISCERCGTPYRLTVTMVPLRSEMHAA